MKQEVLLLALGSNFFFALGSQFFAHFSRVIGATWMNWYKALVAQVCFVTVLTLTEGVQIIPLNQALPLMLSGLIGLGAGDIFLLLSFKEMGPGRTLMLFAFQPLIIGFFAFLFFDQYIDTKKVWAIFFFILCIFIFSLESFRRDGHWGQKGILLALLGMLLDAGGILITRHMFDSNASLSPTVTNFYRTNGALIFFFILSLMRKNLSLFGPLKNLRKKSIFYVSLGSLFGTFISLSLYLRAIQIAHLASLSGVAITGTLFSASFECIWQKKLPSLYLVIAFISFLMGMKVLLL